ncbi:MAG: hypothetical protein V7K77_23165 [Nostoc sp.]
MLGYAIAAPNLQNYGSQGRRGLYKKISRQIAHLIFYEDKIFGEINLEPL